MAEFVRIRSAMAVNKNFVKKDIIGRELTRVINSLKRGNRVIQGSLSVAPGHDYWWHLEYGTGQFHEAPDGDLEEPDSVEAEEAEGGPYEIEALDSEFLVYISRGRRLRRKATEHPGIRPIGFVRTSLFDAMIYLKREVNHVAAGRGKGKWNLPTRELLVLLVNEVLEVLLGSLRLMTPDDSDPDPFHEGRHKTPLSEAWMITKAK
jgi:hypothetical protein